MYIMNPYHFYIFLWIFSGVIFLITYKRNDKFLKSINGISGVIFLMIAVWALFLGIAYCLDLIFPNAFNSTSNVPPCEPDPLFGGC